MARALVKGYATANTDTGHEGAVDDGSFALDHPERVIDFGYRAVHEMTVHAKAVVAAHYGRAPRYSYWNSCSSGGKQGLKEAQQFPTDYDGIPAAPGNFWTHLLASLTPIGDATRADSAHYIRPGKYQLLHNAVLAACDSADGIKDGILNDPRKCAFDPHQLLCKGTADSSCLTASEADAAAEIYRGLRNSRTGKQLYPGLARGSELGWG